MPRFDAAPPVINTDALPHAEQHHAGHANALLFMLNYYVRSFEAALQLYETAAETIAHASHAFKRDANDNAANEALEILDGWPVIAARDGAMSIYHFRKTLEGLDACIGQLPSLHAATNRPHRKRARRVFEARFPHFIKVRHAVAHSGERSGLAYDEHVFSGSWSNGHMTFPHANTMDITLIDVLSQRQYSNTWGNEVVSYKIDIDSLTALASSRDEAYLAFTASAVPLMPPGSDSSS